MRIAYLLTALAGGLMAQTPAPPTLTSIVPSSLPAGSPTQDIVANGTGFNSCTRVRWNGQDLPTSLVNSTQMRAQVSSARLANPGTAAVSVFRYFTFITGAGVSCLATGEGSNTLTFTITVPPPVITNPSPLPNGVLGQNYSVQFNVNGGVPPYDFSLGGTMLPPGLSLSVRGLITGTPTQVGTFNFRVTVTDCDGVQTPNCIPQSRSYSFTINVVRPPAPTITTTSPLPPGTVGQQYSTVIQATGGVAPYRFLLEPGSSLPPGLSLAAAGGLSGIPTASGSFTFTIRVEDCVGFSAAACPPLSSTRQFTLVVQSNLTITTPSLPPATACQNYPPQQMQATGGAPPYTWSATGLPPGLTIAAATGVISGTPTAPGDFTVALTVRDSQGGTASRNLALRINAPAVSRLNITSENPQPGQQSAVRVTLTENAPVELRGELRVSFTSAVGVHNPQVAFSTGATAAFRIPAGQTAAVFDAGNVTLQVGTVAGTITITSRLTANNIDVTPTPAPTATIEVARAAPVITNLAARREGNRLIVEATGFATGREVATAEVQMQPAPGASVGNTSFSIAVGAAFTPYYQSQASIPFGSSFLLTLPFDVTGNPGAVTGVTVTLINPQGRSQSRSANF